MPGKELNTRAVEDYLKAIYALKEAGDQVTTSAIADHLGVRAASVTGMLKKLAGLKLIRYEPYKHIELAPAGEGIALEVIRHHRLIELFLAEALDVPWDQVHEEAERLEHVISEELEDRIDKVLGHPTHDPHGDPIPDRDGTIVKRDLVPLTEIDIGARAIVARIRNQDGDVLRYLGDLQMYPGAHVRLLRQEPLDGPLTIEIQSNQHVIGRALAACVHVTLPKDESYAH